MTAIRYDATTQGYRRYRRLGYRASEAIRIARADERYMHLGNVEFQIEDDDDPDLSWMENDEERNRQYELGVVMASLVKPCPHCRRRTYVVSLGGITLSGNAEQDKAYLNSVRADLMDEAGLL